MLKEFSELKKSKWPWWDQDWTNLAQDRVQWRWFVNTATNLTNQARLCTANVTVWQSARSEGPGFDSRRLRSRTWCFLVLLLSPARQMWEAVSWTILWSRGWAFMLTVRPCQPGLGYGPVAGSCEHGNELSGSIKAGNFLSSWATISLSNRVLLHEINWESVVKWNWRKAVPVTKIIRRSRDFN
jgi:hypothetical protein